MLLISSVRNCDALTDGIWGRWQNNIRKTLLTMQKIPQNTFFLYTHTKHPFFAVTSVTVSPVTSPSDTNRRSLTPFSPFSSRASAIVTGTVCGEGSFLAAAVGRSLLSCPQHAVGSWYTGHCGVRSGSDARPLLFSYTTTPPSDRSPRYLGDWFVKSWAVQRSAWK